MKKIICLLAFSLLLLVSCREFDLSDFYTCGEKWDYVLNEIDYSIEYISCKDDGVNLKITRDKCLIRNEKPDDMYMYSKNSTFDYVLVNNKKVEEELVSFIFPIGIYKIGELNTAEFFVHTSLDNFKGYVHVHVTWQPTTSADGMHVLGIELH